MIVFAIAYADGGYGLTSRTALAVGIWCVVMIGAAFGFLPRGELTRSAVLAAGFLFLFALWTLASATWGASSEHAVTEFNRVSVYLAILGVAMLATSRNGAGRWADGLCLGIVAIAAVSLASRFFPHLFSNGGRLAVVLPYAESRLSFPVGYWNGLGILVSLGFPLCLRSAVLGRREVVGGLSVAALPVLSAVIYLTSSRGAVVTAVVGMAFFVFATERRWQVVTAGLFGAVGSLLAVAALVQRHTLVNGPLSSSLAESQGRTAAIIVCGCSLLAGALYVLAQRQLPRTSVPPTVGRILVTGVLVVSIAGIALAHPIARFDSFKRSPVAEARTGNFATTHLLSGSGSGRWQFWTAAVDEFKSAPLDGRGAGSYEAWWAQHASFTYFLKNAHSLYLEVLGELGIVGLVLVGGFFATGLATATTRLRTMNGETRVTFAALAAVFAAFLAGAAIDWIWQLTAVTGVAIAALGATLSEAGNGSRSTKRVRGSVARSRIGPGVVGLLAVWALVCVQAVPWLAAGKISDSQAAVRRGDSGAALADALDAKSLEPWASSPYIQLALLAEQRGEYAQASRWIRSAIDRDSSDWRSWYLASRMQREAGDAAAAAHSYAKARSLNPRSPVFSQRP